MTWTQRLRAGLAHWPTTFPGLLLAALLVIVLVADPTQIRGMAQQLAALEVLVDAGSSLVGKIGLLLAALVLMAARGKSKPEG